jgi:hypothetical protein
MPCQTDKDCLGEDVCNAGVCIPTKEDSALFAPDPLCAKDEECKEGRSCRDGKCQDAEPDRFVYKAPGGDAKECKVDVDCPARLVCEEKQCQKKRRR